MNQLIESVKADIRRADFNMKAIEFAHPTTYQQSKVYRRWKDLHHAATIRLKQILRMERNGLKQIKG